MTRYKGMAMVLIGSSLWGLSGTVAQELFANRGFTPEWLVTLRLLTAGALFLLIAMCGSERKQVLTVWKQPADRLQMVIFGLIGMLGVQYTYFAAIEVGNAATATLLQFTGPLFITVYVALRMKKLPQKHELLAVALALVGTFLLVTNGSLTTLSISPAAVFWGLVSAVALAFYTLYPAQLMARFQSTVIIGWGMLVGGIGLAAVSSPWQTTGQQWSWETLGYVLFVIVFGTLVPFFLYLDSLRYIKATETSILASAEPLTAVVAAMVWLQTPLKAGEVTGGILIILTVILLSMRPQERTQEKEDGVSC